MLQVVCGAIFAASGASGEAGERPQGRIRGRVQLLDYDITRVNCDCVVLAFVRGPQEASVKKA